MDDRLNNSMDTRISEAMSGSVCTDSAGIKTPAERIRLAREILDVESRALAELAESLSGDLGSPFCNAVELLLECRGSVIVSGMGKAGLIGQKIMATLASTGTRAHFLHPAEAIHGDLGRVGPRDLVILLSQSGETPEIVQLFGPLRQLGTEILAITASTTSSLARAARVTLSIGQLQEAGSLQLAPSTSTTAMLALGDALALVTSQVRNFQAEDFARCHPGGSLGRKLSRVEEYMRDVQHCRVVSDTETVREVYARHQMPERRTGAIILVDSRGCLTGVFTDSDLARLFEHRRDDAIDQPISRVMTTSPTTVESGSKMLDAVSIMSRRRISELPVVNSRGEPIGLIDITDVVAAFPEWEMMGQQVESDAAERGSEERDSAERPTLRIINSEQRRTA